MTVNSCIGIRNSKIFNIPGRRLAVTRPCTVFADIVERITFDDLNRLCCVFNLLTFLTTGFRQQFIFQFDVQIVGVILGRSCIIGILNVKRNMKTNFRIEKLTQFKIAIQSIFGYLLTASLCYALVNCAVTYAKIVTRKTQITKICHFEIQTSNSCTPSIFIQACHAQLVNPHFKVVRHAVFVVNTHHDAFNRTNVGIANDFYSMGGIFRTNNGIYFPQIRII